MNFYHRTTSGNYAKILKDGVLFGGDTWHKTNGKKGYRYTYLSTYDWGDSYGDILLRVDYEPNGVDDNYGFNPPKGEICTQFSVFIPIPASKITPNGVKDD